MKTAGVFIRGAVVFGILASLLLVAALTVRSPTESTTERRDLAAFPTRPTRYADLQPYVKGLDAWMMDRMHYRQAFITGFNRARFELGFPMFDQVAVGRDHWLFYLGDNELEDARGTAKFSAEELQRWKNYLLYRDAQMRERGGRYVFFVAPNKSTIYADYLPTTISVLSHNSRLQQLMEVMSDTDVSVIDLRPVLFDAKKKGQIYLKHDSHWNLLGANYAQFAVNQELARFFPDIHPQLYAVRESDDNEAALIAPGATGDLYRMLGFFDPVREPSLPVVRHVGQCTEQTSAVHVRQWPAVMADCSTKTSPVNDKAWFDLINQHWGYLEQPQRDFLFWSTRNERATHSVFFQHDSFFDMLQPFFSNQFQSVHYSFLGRPLDMQTWVVLLDAAQPDIVLEEIVERGLKDSVPRPGIDYPETQDEKRGNYLPLSQ